MATCPKCRLPNPETAEACIWCGLQQLAAESSPVAVAAASAETVAPDAVIPAIPATNLKPLSSHANVIFTPPLKPSSEMRTLAATPAALAIQQASIATPKPTDTAIQSLQAKLVVIRGQQINQEYPIYPGRNMIGRFADRPVDIDIGVQESDGQIWSSRQHAVITFDKNTLIIEDLNSLNGTWINGTKLLAGTKRPMRPNDVIQIGKVQIRLVMM